MKVDWGAGEDTWTGRFLTNLRLETSYCGLYVGCGGGRVVDCWVVVGRARGVVALRKDWRGGGGGAVRRVCACCWAGSSRPRSLCPLKKSEECAARRSLFCVLAALLFWVAVRRRSPVSARWRPNSASSSRFPIDAFLVSKPVTKALSYRIHQLCHVLVTLPNRSIK